MWQHPPLLGYKTYQFVIIHWNVYLCVYSFPQQTLNALSSTAVSLFLTSHLVLGTWHLEECRHLIFVKAMNALNFGDSDLIKQGSWLPRTHILGERKTD